VSAAVGEEKKKKVASTEVFEQVRKLYSWGRGIDVGKIEGGSGNRVA